MYSVARVKPRRPRVEPPGRHGRGYGTSVDDADQRRWTFLTNHGHVLVALSRSPEARVRDLAAEVGISERSAVSILGDLEEAGYISKERVGRRNVYRLDPERHLRHPAESTVPIASLLAIFENR